MITGQKNKKKPTSKELMGMLTAIAIQLEQLKMQVYNGDKALDEYMDMKGDKEDFVKFLEKKYPLDDKDKKKTEGK
tara:strand:+ start:3330 stop:3557 length:228 start_codon:yes stop_codon:yes gene_type:complete